MNLADNIKKLRKDNNLSQEDLAEKLGVSRQSVSKWESGQAYPEMDKVIQICKLFNLNINDLLNEDINEVKEKKESSNKINKYVDDFLDFITKTVKLFSALRFRDKVKLLIEEFLLILVCIIVYNLFGSILGSIFSFLFNLDKIGGILYSIFNCIYSIVFLILAIIVLVHIFRVRYLDYYKVIDKENIGDEQEKVEIEEKEVEESKSKKFETKKQEKIIIRDEKHSSYSFIKGLANIFIFFIKFILFWILIGSVSLFVCNIVGLVLIFMIRHNSLLFFGFLISGLGSLLFLSIILYLLYYFIFNKKISYKISGLLFIISFILFGIGIGLGITAAKDVKIMRLDGDRVVKSSKTIKMSKDLYIDDFYSYNTEYVEEDRKDIFIETIIVGDKPMEIIEDKNSNNNRFIYFKDNYDFNEEVVRQAIKDLDHNKIYIYEGKVIIHASKENLDIMDENLNELRNSK